ncbi:hypothetical protein GGI01_002310 [Coemansia sp. RSA 376]|nr:hypothetical protein GGI01_002310 [Coemansia sp. RSA 376]
MTSLSIFQLLPAHIVRLIVQVIRVSDNVKHQQLFWVCDNFRTVVYSLYSQSYELKLSDPTCEAGAIVNTKQCPWVLCRHYSGCPSCDLAKDLSIHVELECIYSGKALEILSRAPYKDCVFPLVRRVSLTCNMIQMVDIDKYASIAPDNIATFVQRLRQMAPGAHEFNLAALTHSNWPENTVGYFGSMVNQILQHSSRFKNSFVGYRPPVALDFDGTCHLTHIDYALDMGREQCFQLARQCAPMLQSLRLWSNVHKYEEYLDLSRLIRGDDGNCVVYSHLQKLILDNDLTMLQRPVLGTFVAFPALRHLSIRNEYPFGDDTLFRGNAETLEYLRMHIHMSTSMILRELKVFTPFSHPKLRYVVTPGHSGFSANPVAANAEFLRFVLGIGTNVSVRVIDGVSHNQNIPSLLQKLGEQQSLQILTLNGLRFSLLDIISLIKSLPLLSDLRTGLPKLDSHLAGVPKAQLIETLCNSHAPMGRRLRLWGIGVRSQPMEEAAECTMLLALLCPSLDRVDIPSGQVEAYEVCVRDRIATPPFNQHEQRLQRLLLWERQTIYSADKKCPLY